jgi:hypothetical protein
LVTVDTHRQQELLATRYMYPLNSYLVISTQLNKKRVGAYSIVLRYLYPSYLLR